MFLMVLGSCLSTAMDRNKANRVGAGYVYIYIYMCIHISVYIFMLVWDSFQYYFVESVVHNFD